MPLCFFLGHRDAPESIYPALLSAVRQHAEERGITEFLVGQYGAFDRMAARAAAEVKKSCPHLTLTLLLPYHPAERKFILPEGFDGTLYPPDMEKTPRRLSIPRANRYAVGLADSVIAYARRPGNARELMEYARSRGKTVRCL